MTEHARRQQAVRVADDRPPPDRPRAEVDRIVDEVHPPVPAVRRLVGKADVDRVRRDARRRPRAGAIGALVLEVDRLRPREDEVDRVQRDDRRQHRRAARDIVADADLAVRRPAARRRGDAGELDVERLRPGVGARRPDLRLRLAQRRLRVVELLLADRLQVEQLLLAVERRLGDGGGGDVARLVGLRLFEHRLERPRIDRHQQLALADELPVAEVQGLQIARNARPDVDLVDRLEAAGIIVPVDDRLDQRVRDGDLRRRTAGCPRRRCLPRVLLAATGEGQHAGNQNDRAHAQPLGINRPPR